MRLWFILLAIVFTAAPVMADSDLDQKLQQHKEKQQSLEQQVKEIEEDLNGTRDNLVDVGKSIQSNEKTMQTLEDRIAKLEKDQEEITNDLQADRKSMADLILALERIRRVPPEAMIAKPGAPFHTAQSAMLMGDIIPNLYKKAEKLRINLQNLETVTKDLKAKREDALATSKSLESEHEKLAGLVDKREKLFADTHADLESEKDNVQKISQQAKNLQDLVSRLNEDRQRQKLQKQASAITGGNDVRVPQGQARLPISGIIRTHYDETDNFGAPSKGISIEGRAGALVVAPMGGVVRFAGHFRNYGNIVIIEHAKGFHSLVAGLEKIDTVVGQSVSAGEALGLLHAAETPGERPALYYELRLNGRPVNPAMKFADLG